MKDKVNKFLEVEDRVFRAPYNFLKEKGIIDKVKESKIPCLLVTHDETDKKISHEKPINLNMFIT